MHIIIYNLNEVWNQRIINPASGLKMQKLLGLHKSIYDETLNSRK